ncbi:MAG TPA: hypothetical protein VFS40_00980 [Gemmatimonadales bacterium]|nr:hypothetical protein [Gemmatimonadales bacterium]
MSRPRPLSRSLVPTLLVATGLSLALACHERATAKGGPLAAVVEEARHGRAELPCLPIAPAERAGLAVGRHVPVESCRWTDGDTTTVTLHTADGTVMSVIRTWVPPEIGPMSRSYLAVAERVERQWGAGQGCPQNDQKGVAGDRFWTKGEASVRLYVQLPDRFVLDYELAPGACRPEQQATRPAPADSTASPGR